MALIEEVIEVDPRNIYNWVSSLEENAIVGNMDDTSACVMHNYFCQSPEFEGKFKAAMLGMGYDAFSYGLHYYP